MPDLLTRKGARELTETIDRIASTIQEHHAVLGIDPKIARDYAYRSDLISDAVENQAVINFPRQAADEGEMTIQSEGDDFEAGEINEEKPGPVKADADEPYMATFDQSESHELGDMVMSGELSKFASLLEDAERSLTAASSLPDVLVQGYDGFTDQIRRLDEIATEAMELQAQIDALVGPLLEKKKIADKELEKVHQDIKDAYKEQLTAVGNITIERKTALVEARALLKVTLAKRTATQVQKEVMAAVTEKYGEEVTKFISTTTSALQDTNKQMRVAFQGFELEQRALRTASDKEAGMADLLARFQDLLMKSWRKMVQVVQNAAHLVMGAGKDVDKAHVSFISTLKDVQSGKIAAQPVNTASKSAFDLFAK